MRPYGFGSQSKALKKKIHEQLYYKARVKET